MTAPAPSDRWPLWQRVLFRFFFAYLMLQIAPWNWFDEIPGLGIFTRWYYQGVDKAVRWSNAHFIHVRDTLVPTNGSGDTSWAWAQLWLYLGVAALVCVVWSVLDRQRPAYPRLGYWLRTMVRFYIATFALSYGIIKIFALQMTFPSLSQLSTPLGDLLPMRFSWLFIGYSTPYQVFSGIMETMAGLLLIPRRTVTLGLFAATGAFLNVVMINLSYDVPVKLFASHLLLSCLFLLALDAPRLLGFLALNRGAPPTSAYEPPYTLAWQRWTRLGVKALLLWFILVLPFRRGWTSFQAARHPAPARPFRAGVYDVRLFVRNGDTVPPLPSDTLRWRDFIIDNAVGGSVGSTDPLFWQRYRRGYFRYKGDSVSRTLTVWKSSFLFDSTYLFTARYDTPDTATVRLWTKVKDDSLYVEAVRSNRHFQLAERQFHWLSEYNR